MEEKHCKINRKTRSPAGTEPTIWSDALTCTYWSTGAPEQSKLYNRSY